MKTLLTIVTALALTACGGGSSSSGTLQTNKYAGVYGGTVNETLSGPGGTYGDAYYAEYTLTSGGQMYFNLEGSSCVVTGGNTSSTGNTFKVDGAAAQCYFYGIGWCGVGISYAGVFTGTKVEINGSGVIRCPGYYDVQYRMNYQGSKKARKPTASALEDDAARRVDSLKRALKI